MTAVIIGNVLTIIAIFFTYLNGTRKNKRDMIICDMGAAVGFTVADLVLKGYSGVVQNLVATIRNIVVLFFPKDKYIKWVLLVCGVVFGILFNNLGLVGLLPVVSAFWYSFCVINTNISARTLKFALVLNSISFAVYSIVILNFVGIVSNAGVAFTTLRSYLQDVKEGTTAE